MRSVDQQSSRVLEAVARLLNRRLGLSTDDADADGVVFSKAVPGVPRVGVRDLDKRPFSEEERDFLKAIADLIFDDRLAASQVRALEQRVRLLERENVELSMKNRALTELSSRDALTGLFTRWYVIDKIEAEMNRSLRHGSPMSLLMVDLDHFRHINETHGHNVGDQVLQMVGGLLRESCRIYDIPARYGGEEFCIMLPEASLERTMPVAERIRAKLEAMRFHVGDIDLKMTASLGVAGLESVPEKAIFGATTLIDRADRAARIAKDRGRNRIEVWNSSLQARPAEG